MPDFVYDLPTRQLALYCALLAVGATWFGILFVKPFLRLLVGGEPNVNQTISYATSVFSLFYGLLVGLLAVAAYQNSKKVEEAAFREAASLATIYSDMNSYPEPLRSDLKEMMRDYLLYTVHKDWPAHKAGAVLTGGSNRVDAMRQLIAQFTPETVAQDIVHRAVVVEFHDFADARQQRIAGVITRIPDVLWYALLTGAVINIVLLVMLKLRPFPHLLLGGLTSFFLGVILFVIIALDDPLRGEAGLPPEAMLVLWDRLMVWDEPLG